MGPKTELNPADAGADRAERASECRQHQQILDVAAPAVQETFFRPSEAHTRPAVLRRNPQTGSQFWDTPVKSPLTEGKLKFPTPGLRVFPCSNGITATFEYVSKDPIDESDAIDAQARAGWPEEGYGFYAFEAMQLPDGSFVAVWKAGVSCE